MAASAMLLAVCARYSIALSSQALQEHFGIDDADEQLPRFNVAPTQVVPAIVLNTQGRRSLAKLKWGLVPPWAKDPSVGTQMLNARSETAFEKPAYRTAIRESRCLLPATGFFEWRAEGGVKQPYHIRMKSQEPFALAGLCERWRARSEEELRTCAILTTEPNDAVRPLHDRMPVMLSMEDYDRWLDPDADEGEIAALMTPFPSDRIETYKVTRRMSRAIYEEPDSIEPLSDEESHGGLFA